MKKKNADTELVSPSQVLDTKLTRSEVIDLMIEAANRDLDAKQAELDRQIKELSEVTVKDALAMAKEATGVSIDLNSYRASNLNFVLPPRLLAARVARHKELTEQKTKLWAVQSALRDTKTARLAILRQTLESTDEGRDLLAKVGTLSVALGAKLLAASSETK